MKDCAPVSNFELRGRKQKKSTFWGFAWDMGVRQRGRNGEHCIGKSYMLLYQENQIYIYVSIQSLYVLYI